MSKILVTGDTHGIIDIGKLEHYFFYQEEEFTKEDYLIICGDVAVCGFTAVGSAQTKEFLQSLPVTVLFVDGNHENHPALMDYPEEEWNGGKVHFIADDIIHLMRGQVYEMAGKKFFTFGGAYSVDRDCRVKGATWFEEEMPSFEEYEEGWRNLEKHDYTVDYVITHTAPSEIVGEFGFGGYPEALEQTDEFQQMADQMNFSHWLCGHFHIDEDVEDVYHCLMERVIDLEDYK